MKEVDIKVGGRSYKLAVREGEEDQLFAAAAILDRNARALVESLGQIGETRMLLMSGLVLANHTRNLEEKPNAGSHDAALAQKASEEDYLQLSARMKAAQAEIEKLREDLSVQNEAVERAENLAEQIETLKQENEKLERELNDASEPETSQGAQGEDLFSASQKGIEHKLKQAESAREEALSKLESIVKQVEGLAAKA